MLWCISGSCLGYDKLQDVDKLIESIMDVPQASDYIDAERIQHLAQPAIQKRQPSISLPIQMRPYLK